MGILARIVGMFVGAGIAIGSGYGVWSLIQIILTGATEGNLLLVIAGGILTYFFVGLCIMGVAIGGVIVLASLLGD